MLLDVSKDIIHILVILVIMICTTPVSMTSGREFHVHYWLIRKVFRFLIVFWGNMLAIIISL
jgi:hypothetical protein